MLPPKRNTDFEKLVIGELIKGEIEEVEYDEERKFSYQGKETICPAVRFKFKLEGYHYPHYSRWLRFNVGEKSNLYKNFIAKLVADAKPEMYFDLDAFNGMKVKTIWSENKDFQNLDNIYPLNEKLQVKEEFPEEIPPADEPEEVSWEDK